MTRQVESCCTNAYWGSDHHSLMSPAPSVVLSWRASCARSATIKLCCIAMSARRLRPAFALQQTYKVHLSKLIDRLADSLDLPPVSRKVINADKAWRLGVAETTRTNAVTWYFARHLHTPVVAKHVLEQVRADHALRSAKILTSSEVPLPEGSPLRDFTVLNLSAAARLAHSRFVFFTHRADTPPAAIVSSTPPINSLIYLRSLSVAYVEGQSYALEPMQVKILVALLDNHAHRMEPAALRDACASDADPFQPVKFFGRRKKVYETFIRYAAGDKEYELILSDEDKSWVC